MSYLSLLGGGNQASWPRVLHIYYSCIHPSYSGSHHYDSDALAVEETARATQF